MMRSLGKDWAPAPPTAADLRRLCGDPILDFVFVTDSIELTPAASREGLSAYDCRALRQEGDAGR
jgi:hypothetical protein